MKGFPALTLDRITKTYSNNTIAVKDLSLKVFTGDFVSLVGASGCGKSTVLQLISGLEKASSGNILWEEKHGDTAQKKLRDRDLAFVFQEASLLPWATVADNIYLPLKLAGVPRNRGNILVGEAIELVGLIGFEKSYPRELSGGMKMRVSIARALVTQPQILLMDEPFGALDELTREKLNSDLLTLWQEKHWTVIFVTHNIYEAVYLSNRVLVMSSHPGSIFDEVAIDAPYPRNEDFRTSTICNEYCRQVSLKLREAMKS
jgi:NitT/TauT family transport system ATP-binding protein